MKKWSNKKAEWLLVMLAVSLTASASWTITAEEKSEAIDRYIIVELETLTAPNVDAEEMELSSESEQSTEETVEVESEPEVVLFSLQDSLDSEEYSVTGISVDEPIIAQLLEQTADYQNYDTIALYDITSYQQTTDEPYDFNLQIPEDADITLYQTVDGQLQESTLDVMCTEDEYNRLPLVSYRSETNHWLVFYLGAKQTNEAVSDSDTEDAVRETESAAESLEGKTELEIDESPSASEDVKKHSASKTESETTKPSQQTTAHTHAWVPVTSVVHHDATYKTVWVQDFAAWDETVITKAAWDEQVLVQDAYDENVMISDAYDEPVYAWVGICNECGHKFLDPNEDIDVHMGAGCWSSWHDEWMQVGTTHHDAVYQTVHHEATYQTVHHEAETTIVHHDATGHNEQAVDQAAWDETVITGYTCSGCGAAK
ncbi:MAG: hypothetical protein ACLRKR_12965 [Lachnospiraceae bacterium]